MGDTDRIDAIFAQLDANQDGVVSKAEFDASAGRSADKTVTPSKK